VEIRDGLEAVLAASWDRDTLAVYADHLQSLGDPRGELIVIDLQLEQRSTPELVARRASLLSAWLGRLVPSNPHTSWVGDSFRFGFVEDLVIDGHDPSADERLASVLGSPLALYLKRVTIRGESAHAARVLASLSSTRHSWLTQLSVRTWTEGEPIDDATVAAFIAAAPQLALLEVQGTRVFETFAHPALRRLRVTGWSALPALVSDTADDMFATVTDLDFAFYETYDPAHYAPAAPQVGKELPALQLPALRRLDLARNEPERANIQRYDFDDVVDYDPRDDLDYGELTALRFLGTLALRNQVTHLRLPSVRSEAEFQELSAAVAGMSALVELEITRGHYYRAPELANTRARFKRPSPWPWPRVDRIEPGDSLHVVVPGSRSGDVVPIADAAAVMERRFEDLPSDVRYAWTRFWVFVDELGRSPWSTSATRSWTADQSFPADVLVAALEACEVGGSGGWRELRDELRFRRPMPAGAMVTIHRVRTTSDD